MGSKNLFDFVIDDETQCEGQPLDMNSDNHITLFPSNWLYNASVIGFLNAMDYCKNQKNMYEFENNYLKIDQTIFEAQNIKDKETSNLVVIASNFFTKDETIKSWLEWLKKKDKQNKTTKDKVKPILQEYGKFGYKFVKTGNKLFASKTPFQNLIQLGNWQNLDDYQSVLIKLPDKYKSENKLCDICKTFKTKVVEKEFEANLYRFRDSHFNGIGGSIGKFPNGFWNCNDSLSICPMCSYLIIYSNSSFAKIKGGQIFINAPSFKLMWLLNKYVNEVISKNEFLENSQILGLSFMQLAQKINFTLGAWSSMNIEMIIKRGNEIDYFTIPHNISKVLLNKDIASLIQQSGEFYIFNLVLNGRFSMLPKLNNVILKVLCGGSRENSFIKELYKSDDYSLRRLAGILPELYIKIEKTQTRRS